MSRGLLAALVGFMVSVASIGSAQKLADIIPSLVSPEQFISDKGTGPNHTAHFQLSLSSTGEPLGSNLAVFLRGAAVNQAIVTQLTGLPLGSSSGGFTYEFNDELGTFDRSSDSFGPSFAERALTNGKGKFNFGVNFLAANFKSIDQRQLEANDLNLYLFHNDCCPPPSGNLDRTVLTFEGDVVESQLGINLDTQSTIFFFNYGISNNFDLGLVVPFNRVELRATNTVSLMRLSTGVNPTIHFFSEQDLPENSTLLSPQSVLISDGGSAAGIGDIAIRAKYNFHRGLAAGLEFRLPTGDEEDLLGLGTGQAKFSFIASRDTSGFSPHLNLAYKISGNPPETLTTRPFPRVVGAGTSPVETDVQQEPVSILDNDFTQAFELAPDELSYVFGFDMALAPRVSVAFDFFGRRLFDAGRLTSFTLDHQFRILPPDGGPFHPADRPQGDGLGPSGDTGRIDTTTFEQVEVVREDVNQYYAAIGGKFNLGSTFLLSVNVLIALNDQGLKAPVIPVFGFDYVF